MECNECNFKYVKQQKSNGDFMLKKQCAECGQDSGKQYSFSEVGGREYVLKLKEFDSGKLNGYYERQRQQWINKKQEERQEFFDEYNIYLSSSQWREKRQQVLKRDDYVCQGCLKSRATEVHHLTYNNVYNELLFQLISLCGNCHRIIHKK
jgi:5-methylcytosine-specific restriction endonuclease McrA